MADELSWVNKDYLSIYLSIYLFDYSQTCIKQSPYYRFHRIGVWRNTPFYSILHRSMQVEDITNRPLSFDRVLIEVKNPVN